MTRRFANRSVPAHSISRLLAAAVLCAATLLPAGSARAWVDQDANRIDDAIERTATIGLEQAYENLDTNGRVRFYVNTGGPVVRYGAFIGYDHPPTAADREALLALGVPYAKAYTLIDYIRIEGTWEQIQAIANLPGVARVERVPAFYAMNDNGTRALKARDSNYQLFPTVWHERGITGKGVVIAVLDSGVNDQPLNAGTYPGHQSLIGKFLGGGNFYAGNPTLNTPPDSSLNPENNPDAYLGTYHGTHVAGTAMGTGGPSGIRGSNEPGYFAGVAPDARLVDCKAISDGGVGFGAADAVEWCVANMHNSWGLTGADTIYAGIDVMNLSLGSINEESDGLDASSLAINAAVRAGLVACVATGNDGNPQFISSPAAADDCIAVGALGDGNSLAREDDIVAGYSNEGPRDDDGDADHFDEMKPTVCAPGSGIISADGAITTDGSLYKQINGTSMACPMTAGLCALILQANPNLNPFEVRQLLEDTAEHKVENGKQPPSAVDPFGLDPNYHPSWGWGEPDAYAAVLEALAPFHTQVVEMKGVPVLEGGPAVDVKWTTQREVNLGGFHVLRAPDANGRPGAFTPVSPGNIPGTGDPYIHQASNRTHYTFHDALALEFGKTYWYQLVWVDLFGVAHREPVFPVTIEAVPVVARVSFDYTHNSPDNDLTVWFGTGTDIDHPVYLRYPPGTPGQDSTSVDPIGDPLGIIGNVKHHFHVDLTALDLVDTFLPPSAANPWFLAVREGGYVDQSGRVGSLRITVYSPVETTYVALNPPTETVEGNTVVFWIPLDPVTTLNHTPVLSPIGDRMGDEGQPLAFTVSAADPDGDALAYAATGLPAGAAFDPGTRTFTWTPGFDQAGSHAVTFSVSDPAPNADQETITLDVADIVPGSNRTPIVTPAGDRYVRVGEALAVRIDARDPDGDPLTYSSGPLPAGATFDTETADFAWTPDAGQVGRVSVSFTARDPAGREGLDAFLVTVLDPALAPPGGCVADTASFNGTTQLAANGVPAANQDFPFTVLPNTELLIGTLTWTGGPATDLDFFLLNAANQVVDSSPTGNHPEVIHVANPVPGTYRWRVQSFTTPADLPFTVESATCVTPQTLAVEETGPARKPLLRVTQNYPNPFNPLTRISYDLRESGRVSVRLFSADGRLVRVLEDGVRSAGEHTVVWDGSGPDGRPAASGVYFYTVESRDLVVRRKMVLLK